MPKNSLNVSLKGADDIFSTEESRQEQQREQVQQIPIGELFPFKNHPFKVLDDESMQRTVESVEQYGVLSPLIARPRPEGGYEIISGHRRQHAAQLAGLDALPVIVRQMDDDWLIQFSTKYHLSYMGAVSELLKQLDSLHSYDLLNQYAMKSLTIAPDNPKAYCWLIRSLKAQGMNELATNELAAAKEHLTTEEYEEILAFGANW